MKKIFAVFMLMTLVLAGSLTFAGCASVVPGAWTKLKVDGGLVVYTANMYSSGGPAIVYYENPDDATGDRYYVNCAISISFYPRIMGKDERNGENTTIVDLSEKQAMSFSVSKTSEIYSPDKSVYLNGEKLTPETNGSSDGEYLKIMFFDNLKLKRGNPGGHENNVINVIEYK
ncbi:MAG: hypothetical protein IJS74_04075 [Clostridia bacterium]|nr:hypothetical protein [Clostridia bacterium]